MPRQVSCCAHNDLITTPSVSAQKAGYKPFTTQQLFTAATGCRRKASDEYAAYLSLFPAPLVLPGDELFHSPRYAQSFKSWLNEKERNPLTEQRKTVYVAGPPRVDADEVFEMGKWLLPKAGVLSGQQKLVSVPEVDGTIAYLRAFFHGLTVRQLPDELIWRQWSETCRNKRKHKSQSHVNQPRYVGLTSTEDGTTTRIRVRYLSKGEDFSPYPAQLNLNDILDHAIATLPEDAYCLILLVSHDLYEDEDDDFCCGRAYGGSRISVVSSAQYQPALDRWHGIKVEENHWWPGSHCAEFVNDACGVSQNMHCHKRKNLTGKGETILETRKKQSQMGQSPSDPIVLDSSMLVADSFCDRSTASRLVTPLEAAIAAHGVPLGKEALSQWDLRALYLRRVVLTASHELLHCFGLEHCVHFACAMQGTSSVAEDSRQPPYLCPVCENKLASAVICHQTRKQQAMLSKEAWWESQAIADWRRTRHEAILKFCDVRGDDLGFRSLAAWTNAVLQV